MTKPDRAARVAKRITQRYWDFLPHDERDDLYGHIYRAIRREVKRAVEECAQIAEGYQHSVPVSGGDDLDRIARYSNGTCKLIAAAIRMRGKRA